MRLLNFGEYKGKSFEWAFFHAPSYVQYIHTEDAKGKWTWHDQDDESYFNELYRRADNLTGVCPFCNVRPIARMCLVYGYNWQSLSSAAFACDECGYPGGAPCAYVPPSFFLPGEDLSRSEYQIVVGAIKHQFIGDGRLTQKRVVDFFQTDHFFPDATPGFFGGAVVHVGVG
jgi:hypothetical protein